MWRVPVIGAILGTLSAVIAGSVPSLAQSGPVLVIDMKGAVGVASKRQLSQALEQARGDKAEALVIRLDTPGGLVSATRDMIQAIVAAPVPVVVHVAPSGAHAASAGTFIVYASHLAAMAPGTNLGAATPISIGGFGAPGKSEKDGEKEKTSAAERKAVNDIVAMLRSLAQLRDRNIEFAEKAVREAETMTAEEAREAGVVEIVASTTDELLAAMDGRTVTIGSTERRLATKDATAVIIEPDWRTQLLAVVSDPNVAFILLMIGFYGIILEFWNPGIFVAGTIGAISLILALTALTALPVHYGALGLVLLGMGLMLGEVFTPGIGVLGLGGLIAFVAGAVFLFEGTGWDIEVGLAWPVIAGTAISTALVMFGIAAFAARAYKRPPQTGAEELIGSRAEVVDWSGESGTVRVHGELWAARAGRPLEQKAKVRVVALDGLTVTVEPV